MTPDISPETVERVAEAIFKAFNVYGFVDGLTWRAFEAEARAAIDAMHPSPDLYVPGVWRCAKCEFELIQSNLNANDGTVTARDTPGDKCPNCDTTLWRVSWKAWATDLGKRLDETWDELQALKKSSNDELPPCPICGAAPIEDTMLRAEPYLTCPTVFTEAGKHDVPCPMHAESYEAWSTLCRSAQAAKVLENDGYAVEALAHWLGQSRMAVTGALSQLADGADEQPTSEQHSPSEYALCQCCGREVKADAWLPDDLYAQVSGDGVNGMFCAACLVEKACDTFGWPSVRLSNAHEATYTQADLDADAVEQAIRDRMEDTNDPRDWAEYVVECLARGDA